MTAGSVCRHLKIVGRVATVLSAYQPAALPVATLPFMMQNTITMRRNKNIALVAHDNKKEDLFEWAKFNCRFLAEHSLYATGATGQLLKSRLGLNVTQLESGPLGGDQHIGSRISEG